MNSLISIRQILIPFKIRILMDHDLSIYRTNNLFRRRYLTKESILSSLHTSFSSKNHNLKIPLCLRVCYAFSMHLKDSQIFIWNYGVPVTLVVRNELFTPWVLSPIGIAKLSSPV